MLREQCKKWIILEVIPAVDIMDGKVVRLTKGDPGSAKTYETFGSPLDAANEWVKQGANYLHIIDLDATMGHGDNRKLISEIIQKVKIPIQVGGGMRSKAVAEEMLNVGAGRIIVATLAFRSEDILKSLIDEFGCERIMVALDYLNEIVMVNGWTGSTGLTLMNAMEKFSNLGISLFLLTSISKDGLLAGPDYHVLKNVTKRFKKGLFIAGGITNLEDLIRLKSNNIDGAVIGKALYEGKFTLREAIKVMAG